MTLLDYLRVLRERWRLLVAVLVASIGLSILVTAITPRQYEASARLYVIPTPTSTPDNNGVFTAQAAILSQVQSYAAIVDNEEVLKAVRSDLDLPASFDLKSEISASVPTQLAILDINVTDSSPGRAAAIANSTAEAFSNFIKNETKPEGSDVAPAKLIQTNKATPPSSPSSPQPVLNISIGVLLGLLLGAALAVARDILDNRVKDPEVLARLAGKPAMGVVIEDSAATKHPIATRAGNRNIRAENFRQLRANLQFADVDHHPRVIAICSSVPSEGKTMVAMNLASTLAEAGFTVCLVDADLRRPTIAKVMGLPSPVGLTSVLIHQIDLSEALQNAGSNLYVLSSGPTPPNPSEVLASTYVRDVIRSLLDKVDYVVLDTAPLLPVADGAEVAALADGALLVGRHKVTTESQVRRSSANLSRVDAKLLGVVLNRMPNTRRGEYGYTYYSRDTEPNHAAPEGRRARLRSKLRQTTEA